MKGGEGREGASLKEGYIESRNDRGKCGGGLRVFILYHGRGHDDKTLYHAMD